jgi:hypothetical protein
MLSYDFVMLYTPIRHQYYTVRIIPALPSVLIVPPDHPLAKTEIGCVRGFEKRSR